MASLLREAQRQLAARADPAAAAILRGFFKTGPGEYGAGDRFRGIRVPALREVARQVADMPLRDASRLLASPYHEDRLLALLVLVRQFERGDAAARRRIYDTYLAHTRHVNNWDLVDLSAPNIAGAWLLARAPAPLRRLVVSGNLWERRIAIVATHAFIRAGRFDLTLELAARLLADREDLLHKAAGWMLREVGKRDAAALRGFLGRHAAVMPRTMLRYAIERFNRAERLRWLAAGRRGALRPRA